VTARQWGQFDRPKEEAVPTIKVDGMTCQHCVAAVTKALESVDGTANVRVDLEGGTATYDEVAPVDPELIRRAVEEAGYELG
jgi:copper chaperone CopZ